MLCLQKLTLFVTAAKRDLEGVTLDLEKRSPKVKYNKPRSTNWPNEARTRLLSKQVPQHWLNLTLVSCNNSGRLERRLAGSACDVRTSHRQLPYEAIHAGTTAVIDAFPGQKR